MGGLHSTEMLLVTTCKCSLQRFCFYRCVSVHRGFCSQGGVCSWGCLLPGGVCCQGVWLGGCLVETPKIFLHFFLHFFCLLFAFFWQFFLLFLAIFLQICFLQIFPSFFHHTHTHTMFNERAVHILLECILV